MSKKWVTITSEDIELLKELETVAPSVDLHSLINRFEKTQKKIAISSAKAKGRNLQQWVCRRISDITGIAYNQGDDECEIHSREMGQNGVDIVLRGKAREQFPYSVECKACESLNLTTTVEQAKSNTYPNTDWLIVHNKKSISDTLVIMAWNTFEKLARRR